jgi:acetylornithine deacetylase/succinyl-diaminopimelate desuccinylase-like protein
MPGDSVEDVQNFLQRTVPGVKIASDFEPVAAPASPLDPAIIGEVEGITKKIWGDIPVIPIMAAGGTDSRHLRKFGIPSYGLQGLLMDDKSGNEHVANEGTLVTSIENSDNFIYNFMLGMASKPLSGTKQPLSK